MSDDAAPPPPNPFDDFVYPGYAYWFTHPDHLGLLAWLHYLEPAPASACRVLELGCGDGGNLLSLAQALPESRFVGVDLAGEPIYRGLALAGDLGLDNVDLRQADVRDLLAWPDDDLGSFDFIVAHGLFSWVPDDVREAVLAVIRRALAPNGVAVVSFNAYPGMHDYEALRHFMRFHSLTYAPEERVKGARDGGLWYAAQIATMAPEIKGALMQRLYTSLERSSDALIRHDYLAENEQSFWFTDFMERAQRHGLAFLTNAKPTVLRLAHFSPEHAELLRGVTDPIRQQQYMDFLANTRFRVVALCRAEARLERSADLGRFAGLALEDRAHTDVWAEELRDDEKVTLETPHGLVELSGRPLRIALSVLHAAAPRALTLEELLARTIPELARFGADDGLAANEDGRAQLGAWLTRELVAVWFQGLVHLWHEPPDLAAAVPERPQTGPLQRERARERATVPSLAHREEPLDALERAVLALCDRARTGVEIARELGERDVGEVLARLHRLAFFAPG
ncbi:MAG: class I SAM-dependent methyltransferase [Myxococcales bacterium]|nr:class I SAM-dependent methyltransferase [Myxococcales bacterium]